MPLLATIYGCEGPRLSEWERGFFREMNPLGLILFQRNIESPDQVRTLVDSFRSLSGRADAPLLIDQEGGRVQRLRPPQWRAAPAPARIGALAERDAAAARRAAWLNARLLAQELLELGITVDCLPLLDLRRPEGHGIIGDRAFGERPETVAMLGRETCLGLLEGGVLPVVKHLPGHGRAAVDSHLALPRVTTPREELEATDFAAFRALADMPWGMTAHVVYEALDPDQPATTSRSVIEEAIRGSIGFDGLLLSDDLSMRALAGPFRQRSEAALAAGCDVVLHCNGDRQEMEEVAAGAAPLTPKALARLEAGKRRLSRSLFEAAAGAAELARLLA